MKTIRITIPLDGDMTIEGEGYNDDEWLAVSEPLAAAAGMVISRTRKEKTGTPPPERPAAASAAE